MERLLAAAIFAATAAASPVCGVEQAALAAAIDRAERAEFQARILRKCLEIIVRNRHGHCRFRSI